MDRVAAEVAQEVGVLLEHDHASAGAGEQQAEHHAGRAAADDAAIGLDVAGIGRRRGVGRSRAHRRAAATVERLALPRIGGEPERVGDVIGRPPPAA